MTGAWTERLEVDLTPDGRLAVGTTSDIRVASPGQPQRTVAAAPSGSPLRASPARRWSALVDAKMHDGTVGAGAGYSSEFEIKVP